MYLCIMLQLRLPFFWRIFFGISIILWSCPKGLLFHHKVFLSVLLCLVIKSINILYFLFFFNFILYFDFIILDYDGLFLDLKVCLNSFYIFQKKPVFIKSSLCSAWNYFHFFTLQQLFVAPQCQIEQKIYISLSSFK